MSNALYNTIWERSMADLSAQVTLEDGTTNTVSMETTPPQPTIAGAFEHFSSFYIKYLQILRSLETCYDGMVHPQKRLDIKTTLQYVIRRIIELMHTLVKWNPPRSDICKPAPAPEEPFPWAYVPLAQAIAHSKLRPETLYVTVPRYFKEDNLAMIIGRDKQIKGYVRATLGLDNLLTISHDVHNTKERATMTLEEAVDMIQRHERGRQGRIRVDTVGRLREDEKRRRMYDSSSERLEMDPDTAALEIQRIFRGLNVRQQTREEREEELVFIGMKPRRNPSEVLQKDMALVRLKRKREQTLHQEAYAKDLTDLKGVVEDEEGADIRDGLREERIKWITEEIAKERFPDDLTAFYALKNPPPPQLQPGEPPAAAGNKEAKKKDAKEKEGKKGKADKGKGKAKGKRPEEKEEPPEKPPPLQQKTELTDAMGAAVQDYNIKWKPLNESDNFAQRHDISLAKRLIRPTVEDEIRTQVDEMLLISLQKIKLQLTKAGTGKKGKKAAKAQKVRKEKTKKGKQLPGEKISDIKDLDAENMLSLLIENQLVTGYKDRHISDLMGEFNYLAAHRADEQQVSEKMESQPPDMSQIRQLLTAYCVLPLGDPEIKAKLKPEHTVRSLMLYGPRGAGKTMAVEAIANELGALLINLSPHKLRGLFPGKQGPTKLVHMAFWVARYQPMGPVVIYLDNCELFFMATGKGNKGDKDSPGRFTKDLTTYLKQAVLPEHRIILIGTTSYPEVADAKLLKGFFEKFIYFPVPDYPSRMMLWRKSLVETVGVSRASFIERLDLGLLAQVSEHYTGGAIERATKRVLTARRLEKIDSQALRESELVDSLANEDASGPSEIRKYVQFTCKITGLEDLRKQLEAAKDSAAK